MKKPALSETSLRDLENSVYEALNAYRTIDNGSLWIDDIFDDYIIVSHESSLYKVEYTVADGKVSVAWESAVEVNKNVTYAPVVAESKIPPMPSVQQRRITRGFRTV